MAAGGSESSLEALAQERLDLERQFAELVATVAPQEEAPVHLIPEMPATSEPLVAAQVLWSSMPADDLAESIATLAWRHYRHRSSPPSRCFRPRAGPVREDAPGVLPASTAPIVESTFMFGPEEVRLAAASESVPDGWWTEALPWRTETRVAADQDTTAAVERRWFEPEMDTTEVVADETTTPVQTAALMPFGSELAEPAVATSDLAPDDDVVEWADEAISPAGEYRLFADIAPVDSHEDVEVEPAEADAAVGLHWADDAPVLAGFDEVPAELVRSRPSIATSSADQTPVGGEAAEPVGDDPLFADIAPIVLDDAADVEVGTRRGRCAGRPALGRRGAGARGGRRGSGRAGRGRRGAGRVLPDGRCRRSPPRDAGRAGVAPAVAVDAMESADGTPDGDEAAAPVDDDPLLSDIAPIVLDDAAVEAELAEADAPVDLHQADEAQVLAELDEVAVEPVADVVAQDESFLTADAAAALLETQDEPGVAPAVAVDATASADGTPGGDEAAAPAGDDRLFSDIAPIVLDDAAVEAETAEADAPVALHRADEAPVLAELDEVPVELVADVVAQDESFLTADAAAALLETQDEPGVAPAVAVDATASADGNPRGDEAVASTSEYRLFADIAPAALQEDADVDAPSADALFGSHHVDSAPVTAAASLLSREATEDTTPDWRHAFMGGTPVEAPVAEETPTSSAPESAAPSWPEPPLALEALEPSIEPAPLAAEDPEPWDAFAPELAAEPEPLPQPRPEEPAQPEPVANVPDIVPTVVIVDDGPDRDAWDDLPSEALSILAEPEHAAVVAPDTQMTASVARKKKKRSRRKKGVQADAFDMPPAIAAEVVPADGGGRAPDARTECDRRRGAVRGDGERVVAARARGADLDAAGRSRHQANACSGAGDRPGRAARGDESDKRARAEPDDASGRAAAIVSRLDGRSRPPRHGNRIVGRPARARGLGCVRTGDPCRRDARPRGPRVAPGATGHHVDGRWHRAGTGRGLAGGAVRTTRDWCGA